VNGKKPRIIHIEANMVKTIKNFYKKRDFDLSEDIPHAYFRARSDESAVTLYKSGKLLIQGSKGEAEYQRVISLLKDDDNRKKPDTEPWIGTDESGKGDFFGPLVVAGVVFNSEQAHYFTDQGLADTKKISDIRVKDLAEEIKHTCSYTVFELMPQSYNKKYKKIRNLNTLLAMGHAEVIEKLLKNNDCKLAVVDQFGKPAFLNNALLRKSKNIKLIQKPHAEENPAVAAAAVIARDRFLSALDELANKIGQKLPRGAGKKVEQTAEKIIIEKGRGTLKKVSKVHFKTYERVINNL